jgi:predicted Zn finger-like uncharacterized protein
MYSQCPECQARFRVTAVALRVARGTVRCGRCGSAFDALQRLTDALPDEAEPAATLHTFSPSLGAFDAPADAAAARSDEADVEGAGESRLGGDSGGEAGDGFHFSADDIERVFIDARDWQKRFPSPGPAGGDRLPDAGPSHVPSPAARRRDDDADAEADAADGTPGSGAPVVFVHEPEAIEDITLEGERIVIEGLPELDDDLREILSEGETSDDAEPLPERAPAPHDPDSTDRFAVLRSAPEVTAEAVSEPARDPRTDGSEGVEAAGAIHAPEPGTGLGEPVSARASETAPSTLPPIVPYRLRQREFPVDAESEVEPDGDVSKPRRGGALWGIGVLLLAVVLALQVVHHFRRELARDASIGPTVRSAYARIGRPLAPNWDLAAFELRQWGASESAPTTPGTLAVRASLRNGAGFAQPLPLLRLELEDRFGDTVARRDFEPREYLNDPAQAPRMLASGATTEAALTIVDEGTDAVGYRLDVCMRDEAAVTHCAQTLAGDRSVISP